MPEISWLANETKRKEYGARPSVKFIFKLLIYEIEIGSLLFPSKRKVIAQDDWKNYGKEGG